ncbi:hypothetical protein [Prevotella sp. 10(H)]|uniref:hypothetical protein n=1 Tax=Prevotella sp. 10(H) TaxID=1158294 RepID=UPI000A744B38|nr:hypothetical protein [Prevotella sp. 10(H)]
MKEEYIEKYNYTIAIPYIKYELINCFYSHFENLILLDKLNYNVVEKLIGEEIQDKFYDKDIFKDIELSEKAIAMREKDIAKMIQIVRESVKRNRLKHILKRTVSKILN